MIFFGYSFFAVCSFVVCFLKLQVRFELLGKKVRCVCLRCCELMAIFLGDSWWSWRIRGAVWNLISHVARSVFSKKCCFHSVR